MKRLLTFLLLCLALRLNAATNDVNWFTVRADGWSADLQITTSLTNLAFNYGLDTNNIPTNATVALTVWRPGFTTAGASNWTQLGHAVVGTKAVRRPYPNSNTTSNLLDVVATGANTIIRLALSEQIYPADSITSVAILSAFYGQNIATNLSGVAVTNSSGLNFPLVIADHVLENRRPVNGTQTIEIFGGHKSATQGKPLQYVTVQARGITSGHLETGSATTMTKSSRDNLPVYAIDLNLTTGAGFTRGEAVQIDYAAYPISGDTNCIRSTTNTALIYQNVPLTWTIMDKQIAVVELGVAGPGVVSSVQATADASPFPTLALAVSAIAGTNNVLYSLNRADGGEIQCKTGGYQVGKYNATTVQNGYFTITKHSSATKSQVVFTNFITSQSQYAYQRYKDVTFQRAGNGFLVFAANPNVLVMEGVDFLDGATGWYSGDTGTDVEFLGCYTTNSQFSKGGNDGHSRLNRSCIYSNLAGASLLVGNPVVWIGGYVQGALPTVAYQGLAGIGQSNTIIAYNQIFNNTANYCIYANTLFEDFLIANNLFERKGSGADPISEISDANHRNILLWNNTYTGQRFNHENDITAGYVNKNFTNWSGKFNLFCARGDHRADILDTDGTMVGTWSVGYSVDWVGNYNEAAIYLGDTDFWGLNCNSPLTTTGFSTSNNVAYVSNASRSGTDAGNGDYRLQSSARAILLDTAPVRDWVLPFDLIGNYRGAFDPPGAYTTASPRRGDFIGQ